jgi:hypothetical protein
MSKNDLLFQELKALSEKKDKIRDDWTKAWSEFNNKEAALQRLLLMGSEKDIESLRNEVENLRISAYKLKSQADAWKNVDSMAAVRALVSETEGSTIYQLAKEALEEEISSIAENEERLKTLMEEKLPEAKTAYLAVVKEISDDFGKSYESHGRAHLAEACLGKADRRLKGLNVLAPSTATFFIQEDDVRPIYKRPIK